jgi:hypothetical protein
MIFMISGARIGLYVGLVHAHVQTLQGLPNLARSGHAEGITIIKTCVFQRLKSVKATPLKMHADRQTMYECLFFCGLCPTFVHPVL